MDNLLNALKAQGAAQDQAGGAPRFGIVTSVDPSTATARVTLQPEGVLTGWLPLQRLGIGMPALPRRPSTGSSAGGRC